jgi:hypothetical protein
MFDLFRVGRVGRLRVAKPYSRFLDRQETRRYEQKYALFRRTFFRVLRENSTAAARPLPLFIEH